MKLALDTNAYIALKRGDRGILEMLESVDRIGIPVVVLGELSAGFLSGDRAERNFRELDDFLSETGVEILGIGPSEAERYGSLVKALRELGRPIPTNDVWIAAIALCEDVRLISADAHFRAVPGLVAMGWGQDGK